MKITFLTYGTDGDTRPLLALAHEVIARGHAAHVLADVAGASHAQALGIPFTALAGDTIAAGATQCYTCPIGGMCSDGRLVNSGAEGLWVLLTYGPDGNSTAPTDTRPARSCCSSARRRWPPFTAPTRMLRI